MENNFERKFELPENLLQEEEPLNLSDPEIEDILADNERQPLTVRSLKADLHMHAKFPEMFANPDEKFFLDQVTDYYFKPQASVETVVVTNHAEVLAGHGNYKPESLKFENIKVVDRMYYFARNLEKQYPDKQILVGTEASIDMEGGLNISPEIARALDLVIASVHFKFNDDRYSGRVLAAMDNPEIDIIGHLGRYHQDPESLEWDAIFEKAAEKDKAIEINLNALLQQEFDLDSLYLSAPILKPQILKKLGASSCKISLGSDLHKLAEMEAKESVRTSRLVWLTRQLKRLEAAGITTDRVINTYNKENLKQWLHTTK
jgi:histidinol phosphatase-like PHP family hydrolase